MENKIYDQYGNKIKGIVKEKDIEEKVWIGFINGELKLSEKRVKGFVEGIRTYKMIWRKGGE